MLSNIPRIDLVLTGAVNRLKAEVAKNRLGFLWWLLEPLLVMLVYYTVFGFLLKLRSPDFTAILLVGVMTWQWISRSLNSGANSLLSNSGLISTYRVNYMLFPLISLATEATKSSCVFLILLALLPILGVDPSIGWVWYPVVLACASIMIIGVTLCLALLLPFIPDFLYVVNVSLMALMFGSGIFYSIDNIPQELREYFLLNPIAAIIHSAREALIYGRMPSLTHLFGIAGVGFLLMLTAQRLHKRFKHYYYHLAVSQ